MRGDEQVIDYLNRALRHELAAVNQYWLHYRILLDGQPNMQSLDQLRIGRNVKEILECDLAAEMHARVLYLEAARHCEQVNDRVSRILFESLTTDEEKHIDFLEAQLTLVEQLGVQLYAQKHVGELEGD
jgi:bacterioferritin